MHSVFCREKAKSVQEMLLWLIVFCYVFCLQIVHPLGNTTFEIVFLARLVGNVENTLFIHTSKGVYPYQVQYNTNFI